MAFRDDIRPSHPGRTAFSLSHERLLTCNMGQLIPILSEFAIPGDVWNMNCSTVVRFNPLIHPLMAEVNCFIHSFFVPLRKLYPLDPPDDSDSRRNPFCWEDFVTGGVDGRGTDLDTAIQNVMVGASEPRDNSLGFWTPGLAPNSSGGLYRTGSPSSGYFENPAFNDGSLWDFFRFPSAHVTGAPPTSNQIITRIQGDSGTAGAYAYDPIDAPWRAYASIWWEYYRDEIINPSGVNRTQFNPNDANVYVPPDHYSHWIPSGVSGVAASPLPFDPLRTNDFRRPKFRAYEKDYFLSAQFEAQRGAPGVVTAVGEFPSQLVPVSLYDGSNTMVDDLGWANGWTDGTTPFTDTSVIQMGRKNGIGATDVGESMYYDVNPVGTYASLIGGGNLSQGSVRARLSSFTNSASFDINDLRFAYALQHDSEVNQRFGTTYTNWLYGRYGISPRDERLQRPEYIGGSVSPVIFSEVLQTSASTVGENALGQLGGHGMSVNGDHIGNYLVTEYGVIMTIMSILPRAQYAHGFDKQWIIRSPYDVYRPDFAFIGEQAVDQMEISGVVEGTAPGINPPADLIAPDAIFGYQGAFDCFRQRTSSFHGLMRHDLSSWHLGRFILGKYDGSVLNIPSLSADLITSSVDDWDRAFAVTSEVADELVVSVGHDIKVVRCMPFVAVPHIDGMEDR